MAVNKDLRDFITPPLKKVYLWSSTEENRQVFAYKAASFAQFSHFFSEIAQIKRSLNRLLHPH
jgi:hypothetical protein